MVSAGLLYCWVKTVKIESKIREAVNLQSLLREVSQVVDTNVSYEIVFD